MHSLLRIAESDFLSNWEEEAYILEGETRRSRLEVNGCLHVNSLSFLFRFSLPLLPYTIERSVPSPIKIRRGMNLVNQIRIRIDHVSSCVQRNCVYIYILYVLATFRREKLSSLREARSVRWKLYREVLCQVFAIEGSVVG